MPRSAGMLMYRVVDGTVEVLLAHPGGPYFARKDEGSWTVPKGLVGEDEEVLTAAVREFEEETSFVIAPDAARDLGEVRQKGGKIVYAWACVGDVDPEAMVSNTFEMEWPPRSGQMKTFPEIDRVGWFPIDAARSKMIAEQRPFLDRLLKTLETDGYE